MNIVDMIFLFFMGVSLYFIFLFLLIFLENKKKMDTIPKMADLPFVSIIVPAYNERKHIGDTIENLKKIDYKKKEIIIVNDGSTDKTAEIAKKSGVRVVSVKKGGKARALNYAIQIARGEIIATVDADSYPEKDILLKSVPFFQNKKVVAVTTKIYVKNKKSLIAKIQEIEYGMISWGRKVSEYIESIWATPGPMSLYRKSVLKEVGGFDEKNATEDIEIAWRLLSKGYKIRMSPGKTYTNVPSTFRKWWHQRIRWNIGGMQTFNKYKGSAFKRGSSSFKFFIVPFFFFSYILSIVALGLFVYLIYNWIFNFFVFNVNMMFLGLNPFKHLYLDPIVNVLTFLGISVFLLSLALLKYGSEDIKKTKKDVFPILLYLTIYLMIFPILLIYSIAKISRGYKEW